MFGKRSGKQIYLWSIIDVDSYELLVIRAFRTGSRWMRASPYPPIVMSISTVMPVGYYRTEKYELRIRT